MRATVLLSLALAGCAPRGGDLPSTPEEPRPSASAAAPPTTSAAPDSIASADVPTEAASTTAPPEPTATADEPAPTPVTMRVGFERAVWVLPGKTNLPIVYLHGRCGDPKAFTAFARAASNVGTLVSFVGDQACKGGDRFKWSGDVVSLDKRISRTLEHVGKTLDRDLAAAPERVAIGYSQGALMAESLGTRFPERYARVVLIGGPRAPKDTSLGKTSAVLLMAGDLDARQHLRLAKDDLERRGKRASYLELPGARHGEYGAEAERVMGEAFSWLLE